MEERETLAEYKARRDKAKRDMNDLYLLLDSGDARALREWAGMSFRDFSDRYGVPISNLHHWESGTARPTYSEHVGRYMAALHEIRDLMESGA